VLSHDIEREFGPAWVEMMATIAKPEKFSSTSWRDSDKEVPTPELTHAHSPYRWRVRHRAEQ
jgi:hypothetical protein